MSKENNIKMEESTVFSDPKKHRENKKESKKTLKRVLIAVGIFVLVFAVIPFMTLKVITAIKNDAKRAEIPTLYEAIESATADTQAENLFALKIEDETDKEAIEKILDELLLEENAGEYEVFCSEDKVTLKFKYAPDKSRADWFENNMVKNSCALISLVAGLNEVAWEYPAIDKTHGFKRSEVKEFLGYEAAEFSASAKAIQVLLNRLGLNEL